MKRMLEPSIKLSNERGHSKRDLEEEKDDGGAARAVGAGARRMTRIEVFCERPGLK